MRVRAYIRVQRVVITIENRIWKAVRGVNDTDGALIWRHSHRVVLEKSQGARMHNASRAGVYALFREISRSRRSLRQELEGHTAKDVRIPFIPLSHHARSYITSS